MCKMRIYGVGAVAEATVEKLREAGGTLHVGIQQDAEGRWKVQVILDALDLDLLSLTSGTSGFRAGSERAEDIETAIASARRQALDELKALGVVS